LAQDWIANNCNEFIGKGKWPPNSPDVNLFDYHVWGVMLERYKTFHSIPQNSNGLKKVLQLMWDQLPQDLINQQGLDELHKKSLCKR